MSLIFIKRTFQLYIYTLQCNCRHTDSLLKPLSTFSKHHRSKDYFDRDQVLLLNSEYTRNALNHAGFFLIAIRHFQILKMFDKEYSRDEEKS